ncbi:Uma2 family endonuclease [Cohnella herbarum]|uniref:Uma2 family endonuclease n=1 Tax=Cohnella herbarum TaxID=2728023 RepID=A0A7Z2VKA5_9BACL|nr:Uma2 family endonuclease [Cohnella herbarum]QJD84420.1 Uma2 family endonuclease [Cohnella herbarum]
MASKKTNKDRVKEQPVTYEIYAGIPDDGRRYEVLEGELELMSPGSSAVHQMVGMALSLIVQSCSSEYVILTAPLDVILSRTNVVQPDLVMIHRNRAQIVSIRGIEGVPDLVVEVLSPSSRKKDRLRKLKIYAEHGIPEYWIIDPATQTLEQLELIGNGRRYEIVNLYENDDVVASGKLPCVSFAVSELFKDEIVRRLLALN